MGSELGAVVAADMIGRATALEQVSKSRQHIVTLELALNMDCQALAAMFVDHGEHAERLPVMRAVHDKVIAPHMTRILRPDPPRLGRCARSAATPPPAPAAINPALAPAWG